MTEQMLVQLVRETVVVMLMTSLPLLMAALIVGVSISILQVVTSIQDMTMSFVPRIVVVFLLTLALMPWLMEQVSSFAIHLVDQFPLYIK